MEFNFLNKLSHKNNMSFSNSNSNLRSYSHSNSQVFTFKPEIENRFLNKSWKIFTNEGTYNSKTNQNWQTGNLNKEDPLSDKNSWNKELKEEDKSEDEVLELIEFCFSNIMKPNNIWLNIFDAINTTRSLLKFYFKDVLPRIQFIIPSLSEHAKSSKSNLAKISLIFMEEILMYKQANTKLILDYLIPVLLQIASQKEKRFLTDAAEKALETALKHQAGFDLLYILMQEVKNKKPTISNVAYNVLEKLISEHYNFQIEFYSNSSSINCLNQLINKEAVINKLEYTETRKLLILCSEIYDLKKSPYIERSISLFKFITQFSIVDEMEKITYSFQDSKEVSLNKVSENVLLIKNSIKIQKKLFKAYIKQKTKDQQLARFIIK